MGYMGILVFHIPKAIFYLLKGAVTTKTTAKNSDSVYNDNSANGASDKTCNNLNSKARKVSQKDGHGTPSKT